MSSHFTIPEPSLVVLVGASGAGKSTFAARHFRETEIVSSDRCRALVSDEETRLDVNEQAFSVVHAIVRARLSLGRLVVVDATNVQAESRSTLVKLAREADLFAVAIVLNVPARMCEDRNAQRTDRQCPPHVIRNQASQLRRSLKALRKEGFKSINILDVDEIDAAQLQRTPLWSDRRGETGPFDVIGDIHGCLDELLELLDRLGYVPGDDGLPVHPEGRRLIFVGDLVDRGPNSVGVLDLVRRLVESGRAFCVPGNHDEKLLRKLRGKEVRINHGLAETLAQVEALPPDERARFISDSAAFIDGLVSHYVLDEGRLVVAHAGMKAEYQGRSSGRVRAFALFGETTGESDDFGLPVRYPWARDYRGGALVVYGHTPVPRPERLNRTINIDTGCVFGGALSALRYPEDEVVSVPARRTYAEPARPFLVESEAAPEVVDTRSGDEQLRIEDVIGKRVVRTRLMGNLTIKAEQAGPALEILSRFAVDPRWLIYLPPTMAPGETARAGADLEHPAEAFAYFREAGVPIVVCEEKHMGSRAVLIVCRSPDVALSRFKFDAPQRGVILTRTGRSFFNDAKVGADVLDRLAGALEDSGLWDELATDWLLLDAELMPWSAKAEGLLREQFAPVGAAGLADLSLTATALTKAAARGVDLAGLVERTRTRATEVERYVAAYRRYCWPTTGVSGLRLAPFQLLASEGKTYFNHDHSWHMELLARLAAADSGLIFATPWRLVNLLDETEQAEATAWWSERTAEGMEGMVVKPLEVIRQGAKGLIQPAVKVRGHDYLRIIYGPEYALPENLARLRSRSLGRKRAMALREFALGVEAIERFVAGEPLYRVHECVAAILALESEPVDPRL